MSTREVIEEAGARRGEDYFTPGATERREAVPCRSCGALVLTGLDAEVAGIPVVVEPHPVDRAGELTALMTGRRTFGLVTRGRRQVIRDRSAGQIALHPADTMTVVAEHRCGVVLGRPLPPPPPPEPTFLDMPLSPCSGCGLPAVTNPCGACRRAAEGPRPIQVERSETNEADLADDVGEWKPKRHVPAGPPPVDPPHACAGEVCGTWGCSRGNA